MLTPASSRETELHCRGLVNSKLEGLNSKIRLINHHGCGHRSAAAFIAMIYLCAGGLSVSCRCAELTIA